MVVPLLGNAQLPTDSLWSVWRDNSQADTNRLKAIEKIVRSNYLYSKPDSAFYFAQQQFDFAQKVKEKDYMAVACQIQGIALYFQHQYDEALEYYKKCIRISEEIGAQENIVNALSNMGIIYTNRTEYEKAVEIFTKCIEINKEIGNEKGIASSFTNLSVIYGRQGNYKEGIRTSSNALNIYKEIKYEKGITSSLNNLGLMYSNLEEYDEALAYYVEGLKHSEKLNDNESVAGLFNNIGNIYLKRKQFKVGLRYFQDGLEITRRINNISGEALSLHNIGSSYENLTHYDSALTYYSQSLELYEQYNDKNGIALNKFNMGISFKSLGKDQKAFQLLSEALDLASEIENAKVIRGASRELWLLHKKRNNYAQSLVMHELYISIRDSLNSVENQKEAIRQQYQYEYEKQAAADSIKAAEEQKVINAELAAEKAVNRQYEIETKRQALQNYALFGGFAITLLFSGFIYNRVRVVNRQKNIIQEQKYEVDLAYDQLDVKNKEVHDSIVYAKRIQSAILPADQMIKKYLNNSFVLYKPKDIVSGDFYWMEPLEDKLLFAAADCTGHGVPGAMVSVICTNSLNRAVREYGYSEPGLILSKAREIIISEFAKSGEEVRDGMDIALCSLEKDTLKFAGANNPLWIIRNGADEIDQLRADRQPVGKFDNPKPYYTHTIQLKPGDTIYLFSDGYADQFGGSLGKKLKSSYFKKLLLSFQDKPMDEQKELLDNALEKWKGDLEQVDDICVIGFRKEDDTINNKS